MWLFLEKKNALKKTQKVYRKTSKMPISPSQTSIGFCKHTYKKGIYQNANEVFQEELDFRVMLDVYI